jgi:putative ABC transport system substrate-binding protein
MKRLTLLSLFAFAVVAWPMRLAAQQPPHQFIGFLSTASPSSSGSEQMIAFRTGLRDSGYIEGKNLTIEYRWASDDYSRLTTMAAEMVKLRPAVIVTAGGHVSALVTQDFTKDIPIVFTTVTDPVKDGLVASLNRPGGNATGTAGLTSELDSKRLELLHEMTPSASLIGVLVNPNRPGLYGQSKELQQSADRLGVKLAFQNGATAQEIDSAFEAFVSQGVQALLVPADPLFNNRRTQIVTLAAKHSFPAIYQWREFVSAGGLMSYGPSIAAAYHHAGVLAGLILKGAKPADLPVVQPVRFQLIINLNTARQLGLTTPPAMVPDEVIE